MIPRLVMYVSRRALSLTARPYAKQPGKGKGLSSVIQAPEPERDTEILQKYCCGLNFIKDGKDPELKQDSEYPDWLWSIHTGPPKTYKDYDPNTREYWYALEKAKEDHQKQIEGDVNFYRPPKEHELGFYSRLTTKNKQGVQ